MKNLAFILLLFLVSCGNSVSIISKNGEKTTSDNYVGNCLVKKIELQGSGTKYVNFRITAKDINGNILKYRTSELTYNVGDSIHIDVTSGICYPLNDPTNIAE